MEAQYGFHFCFSPSAIRGINPLRIQSKKHFYFCMTWLSGNVLKEASTIRASETEFKENNCTLTFQKKDISLPANEKARLCRLLSYACPFASRIDPIQLIHSPLSRKGGKPVVGSIKDRTTFPHFSLAYYRSILILQSGLIREVCLFASNVLRRMRVDGCS